MSAICAAPGLDVCRPAMSTNLIWKAEMPEVEDEGVHWSVESEWRESVPATLLNATAACIYDDDEEDMVKVGKEVQWSDMLLFDGTIGAMAESLPAISSSNGERAGVGRSANTMRERSEKVRLVPRLGFPSDGCRMDSNNVTEEKQEDC